MGPSATSKTRSAAAVRPTRGDATRATAPAFPHTARITRLPYTIDARAKLLLMLTVCICVLHMQSPLAVTAVAAIAALGIICARPKAAHAARLLLPFAASLLIIVAFYALRADGSANLALVGPLGVSTDGLNTGLLVAGRFLALALAATLVAFTTQTDQIAQALAWFLRPAARLGLPVDDAAMALALALRMIPDAASRGKRIADAMRVKGVNVGAGGPLAAVKSWIPVAIPLVVGLFRRSEAVADAMRARCYRSRGRTVLPQSAWSALDSLVLLAGAFVLVALAVFA